jgi:hypothetical protein
VHNQGTAIMTDTTPNSSARSTSDNTDSGNWQVFIGYIPGQKEANTSYFRNHDIGSGSREQGRRTRRMGSSHRTATGELVASPEGTLQQDSSWLAMAEGCG